MEITVRTAEEIAADRVTIEVNDARLYTAAQVGDAQASEAELVAAPLRRRIEELTQSLAARDRLLRTASEARPPLTCCASFKIFASQPVLFKQPVYLDDLVRRCRSVVEVRCAARFPHVSIGCDLHKMDFAGDDSAFAGSSGCGVLNGLIQIEQHTGFKPRIGLVNQDATAFERLTFAFQHQADGCI